MAGLTRRPTAGRLPLQPALAGVQPRSEAVPDRSQEVVSHVGDVLLDLALVDGQPRPQFDVWPSPGELRVVHVTDADLQRPGVVRIQAGRGEEGAVSGVVQPFVADGVLLVGDDECRAVVALAVGVVVQQHYRALGVVVTHRGRAAALSPGRRSPSSRSPRVRARPRPGPGQADGPGTATEIARDDRIPITGATLQYCDGHLFPPHWNEGRRGVRDPG